MLKILKESGVLDLVSCGFNTIIFCYCVFVYCTKNDLFFVLFGVITGPIIFASLIISLVQGVIKVLKNIEKY